MSKSESKRVVTVMPVEELRRLDKVMKRHGVNQSQAVRNILSMGMDVYEDLERIGIPQTLAFFDGLSGKLKAEKGALEGTKT